MTSPESRYDDLTDRASALYDEGKLEAALEVLAEPRPGLEPWFAELAHFEACLHGALGDTAAGGRAALDWALTEAPTAASGVVVLAPALRELPAEAQGPLTPATVLIGTGDDLREVVDEAADKLTAFGLAVQQLPGLVHEYPQDFAQRLAELLPSCG
ncbi:hypothetical protein F1D05_20870 [Kribbella qitaiheensis]|uniref:Alpha/beta hydrolase n=1 Tax=Kribbella qitaiheensis TaxID=1544730 RepID=A0A7G6X0Z9_9ACTN|nr:hypothetical protein [Kribbella qitaiheensis]QNE19914.1 hypothetical protein F1D05_20870 [Kribbella qitaiheensis]